MFSFTWMDGLFGTVVSLLTATFIWDKNKTYTKIAKLEADREEDRIEREKDRTEIAILRTKLRSIKEDTTEIKELIKETRS